MEDGGQGWVSDKYVDRYSIIVEQNACLSFVAAASRSGLVLITLQPGKPNHHMKGLVSYHSPVRHVVWLTVSLSLADVSTCSRRTDRNG